MAINRQGCLPASGSACRIALPSSSLRRSEGGGRRHYHAKCDAAFPRSSSSGTPIAGLTVSPRVRSKAAAVREAMNSLPKFVSEGNRSGPRTFADVDGPPFPRGCVPPVACIEFRCYRMFLAVRRVGSVSVGGWAWVMWRSAVCSSGLRSRAGCCLFCLGDLQRASADGHRPRRCAQFRRVGERQRAHDFPSPSGHMPDIRRWAAPDGEPRHSRTMDRHALFSSFDGGVSWSFQRTFANTDDMSSPTDSSRRTTDARLPDLPTATSPTARHRYDPGHRTWSALLTRTAYASATLGTINPAIAVDRGNDFAVSSPAIA